MAREYRIECGESIDRQRSLEVLGQSPYFRRPSNPFQEGEVWLSLVARPDYADVRIFPRSFGFFLEITSLPGDLSKSLHTWIAGLQSLGGCIIIDNDTEEVVQTVR